MMSKLEFSFNKEQYNDFAFYYDKNTLDSEESWLGIDLFNNDPQRSWWTLDENPYKIKIAKNN